MDDQDKPFYLIITIKQSKTDSFRKGMSIIIGSTVGPLCPVVTILACMVRRKLEGHCFGFRTVTP